MTNPSNQRLELEARNAAMREKMTSLLAGVSRQAEQLKQVQEHAASATGEATSRDGLVNVRVNSAGIVTDLQINPAAFRSTTAVKLSQAIVHTIQQAARNARAQADEVLAPMLADLPDMPDLFEGAPSFKDLTPKVPDIPDTGVVDDDDRGRSDDDDDEDDELASRWEERYR
ncbi:YbaB/EbfC family nucleoid-associated protein [Actinoalloteichus hymeniacidonis]|uniref:YbaB/EbfC DNA-binding family protein n=1 Tax=Actinoalloteichus hymeniacidonis TaxID=340345 RepID=A0AAC9HM88_9PSEU|nr:YbaB/EbfC family nucleoid-associated protein [Actinoalloteichus hymeniacidonis]AOS61917.1 hypothetical protein TL08_05450 [Actinoalloteichus hymeniacidonis]MBB5910063.1 DNA-binding protein YbaB [Actinoalloteichus hymeniacidonis]